MIMLIRAVTVLALAFFLAIAFQTFQLVREHSNLETAFAGQQTPVQQALQIRQETESLAGDTAALADRGNANAKTAVEEMRRQGIALREPAAPAQAPAR
jgi:hypothetical protein